MRKSTLLKVLFVCVENSNRSQMAAAFARIHAPEDSIVNSAGSKPSGKVNPMAIQFMQERGIDLSSAKSIAIHDLPFQQYDAVISMGCGDDCPSITCNLREDWQIPDPKHLDAEGFRIVRDYIEIKVVDLLKRL